MEYEERLRPRLLIAILSVSLLILCGLLTETATNIAFPTLMEEYGVSASSVQWLTTGKMLVVAMITPISAYLKKRFITKKLFLFSGITFLIGCLMGTLAWNFEALVLSAVIQGIGIGVSLPLQQEHCNVSYFGYVSSSLQNLVQPQQHFLHLNYP